MEMYKYAKANEIISSPDVVAASCIDATYDLIFKEVYKNGRE